MTYWALNGIFLAVVAVVGLAAVVARRAPRGKAIGLAAIAVLILTAVFDNVLVGLGIVGYDPARISGVVIGVAPLEDFAYSIAVVVLLPSLWTLLTPSRSSSSGQRVSRRGAG